MARRLVLGSGAAELEARGHVVHTPDLPCEDVAAGVEEYAAGVPAADVVAGHSLGGFTIPLVHARTHVFVTAGVGGTRGPEVLAPGFGAGQVCDELGRSYYPDPTVAAAELQYPPAYAELASRLRRQAPLDHAAVAVDSPAYVVCARDAVIRPEWQRHLARDVLGVEPIELEAGHSPMLERPRQLAAILDSLA
ncbi:MAG TPA: alpha/beta hydrolase [Gaiellaceae bacterium]|nr:alpha/beta hydrolase [Gaiellaceae bacterium]